MTIEQYNPTTELATVTARSGYDLIRSTAAAMADANAIAKAVCSTDMVPKHFRGKPDDLTAAMLYGATLGFDPMQSARQVFVIHGQAALYARSMAALVMAAGHQVRTVETSDTAVTVEGRRRGADHVELSTWTIDRAKKAGYTDNAKYRTDPQAMLYAKALSEVCRKIAPDVLNGVYAVEEMQMERVESERVDQPVGAVNQLRAALNPSPAQATPSAESPDAADAPATVEASTGEALDVEPMFDYRSGWARAEFFPALRAAEEGGHFADPKAFMSEVVGRDIASSKELTEAEAQLVLAHLPVIKAADVSPEDAFPAEGVTE
ncbi:recombinase RecT [Nocardioides sp. WS12]|uniref:recombinase RecT n=1 Tax=Nocardioides sp. WS12 TaxID=2486272 RepID=UPI0015F95158|nr:recombinase RecT [Nocardioides sp. WS12]